MQNFFHFHLFISFFFSILFAISSNEKYLFPLNSNYIKQAKERFMSLDPSKLWDPPMPPYTFTIYHRDVFEKLKFKDYDLLLQNRLARCEARANHLASIFEEENNVKEGANVTLTWEQETRGGNILEKIPKTTSIYGIQGEYVAAFLLGSDEVKNLLLIDTGSDLVWWQCGPCEENKCYKQITPLYFPTNSKTFRRIDCSSRCLDDVYKTYECNPFNECVYDIKFTGGPRSKGFMADDVIAFILPHRPIRVSFGCGKDQMVGRKNFSGDFSGVLGLGRIVNIGSYSLPSQFKADLMSMCLPGFYSGKASTLSFHTTPWPRITSAKLLTNHKHPLFYYVNLYKVFINDKVIPVHPSWWALTKEGGGGVLVDTGTIITRFPTDLYIVFRYIFRSEVTDIPMVQQSSVKILDTCYKADPDGPELYFPVVKLYFGSVNSKNMLLLAKERVMVHFDGYYCLAFTGWNRSHSIIGGNQLQGIGLTFDTSENTLSFDLDACE